MLIMVIEKPMQFTIVSAVPFNSAGAYCATNAENCGESATTAIPQNIRKVKKKGKETPNTNGETKQHMHDDNNAINAVFLLPKICEKYPPKIHDSNPEPIMINDNAGIFNTVPG